MIKERETMVGEFLGIPEISELTGIPERTISYKLKNSGLKPDRVINKKHYYKRESVVPFFSQAKGAKQGKVICFANQKGGIGKTTTALNLGLALASKGYATALIDFDAQGNLSGQFCDPEDITATIGNLLELKSFGFTKAEKEQVQIKTHVANLTLFPSNIQLAGFLIPKGPSDYDRLDLLCKKITDEFDFILIDCPPSLGLALMNALLAADVCIVPSTPSHFSLMGISDLQNSIAEAGERNKRLRAFTLVNKFNEQRQLAVLTERIKRFFPILKTRIPDITDIEKVQALPGKTLDQFNKKVFANYLALAEEVEALFGLEVRK